MRSGPVLSLAGSCADSSEAFVLVCGANVNMSTSAEAVLM